MDLRNDISNFVFDLVDRSHLLVRVQSLILSDFLSQFVGFALHAVFSLDLGFGEVSALFHNLVYLL